MTIQYLRNQFVIIKDEKMDEVLVAWDIISHSFNEIYPRKNTLFKFEVQENNRERAEELFEFSDNQHIERFMTWFWKSDNDTKKDRTCDTF